MKIERLSPSSFKTWDTCPHAFWIEQNLGYRWAPHIKADMGTAVHLALEIMAIGQLQKEQDPSATKIQIDSRKMDFNIDDDPNIFLDFALSRKPAGFFSAEQISQMREYLDTALTFSDGEYDPRNRKIKASEKRLKIPIPENWALISEAQEDVKESRFSVTGVMDLVTELDEDTLEIIDWKCAQPKNWDTMRKKRYADFYDDIQLRLYHWAATQMYPEYKNIIVTIFYLTTKDCFNIPFTLDDVPKTLDSVKNRYLEISQCEKPKRNIKDFFCHNLCGHGKTPASLTNLPDIKQEKAGGIAEVGQPMTVCDSAKWSADHFGLEFVELNYSKAKKKQ